MKKIISIFILCLFFQVSANAEDWTSNANVKRVNTIGQAILTKIQLPNQVTFTVDEQDEINAYANGDNEIHVYTGLLKSVENDSELAGVISHEIGHIVNSHVAKQTIANTITSGIITTANVSETAKTGAIIANNLAMKKVSRKEEYEADVTGVDLMTSAGYSPLAMVSFLYKISGKYQDFLSDHPSGDKRTMYIYDYITYTYPAKAKENYNTESFKQFMAYATPIIEKRNASPRKLASFNKKQEKLKKQRAKKLAKYKTAPSVNGWDASYNLLRSFLN